MTDDLTQGIDRAAAYTEALNLLHECQTAHGFVASPLSKVNYHRIWTRDGGVMTLAALMTGEEELLRGVRQTLMTLGDNQGPHGEIPSNVDPQTGRVSYGGTAGRVDADLWFLIAAGQYWKATGDEAFLDWALPVMEWVQFLLGAWEFNNRGLLYIPMTGDWADEYLHHGYVLYDQLLYLQAQREMAAIHDHIHGGQDHILRERIARLRHVIRANYWLPAEITEIPDDVYHEIIYKKALIAASRCGARFWLPFFTPGGYGYRFDSLANILASLLGVADAHQQHQVANYIEEAVREDALPLLPAFHPVITPGDEEWEELRMSFSYQFKNAPFEYHNGGIWPMVNGFYVAELASRGWEEGAEAVLNGIHWANTQPGERDQPAFPEFIHGRHHTPGGQDRLGWSAAGAVIGQRALAGAPVFR